MDVSPLKSAIVTGLAAGGELTSELARLGDYPIAHADEAEFICGTLERELERPNWHLPPEGQTEAPALVLAGLLQDPSTPEAYLVFAEQGLKSIQRMYDTLSALPHEQTETQLFLLKLFGMYNTAEGLHRIIEAAHRPLAADDLMWPVILKQFDLEHPARHELVAALRDPLPPALIGLGLLNLANQLILADELVHHPFDTPEGHRRLAEWLADPSRDGASAAQVVATSLPFMSDPPQADLLATALRRPEPFVQLEAAWAAARLGQREGLERLAALCLDPVLAIAAANYLGEFDRKDLVPSITQTPAFQAQAKMIGWLAHPLEFGRPPDAMELIDESELHWPPTGDRRPFWMFRYRYEAPGGEHFESVGLVGSETFSLRVAPTMDVPSIYALHCGWELQIRRDPRAPAQLDIATGAKLLADANAS